MQRSLASRTSNFQRIYLAIGVAVITLISLFIGFASYDNRLSELSSEQESNHLAAHNKTSSELQESGEQMIEHLLRLKLELITTGLLQPETPFDARAFETIFLQSIQDSNSLDQIRWIDLSGDEKARVDRLWANQQWQHSTSNALQNKKHRYYFTEILLQKSNSIYNSPLDLNRENKQLVIPYEPTLRLGVLSTNERENLKNGMIVVNHNLAPVMRNIKQSLPENIQIEIIDTEGYWVLNSADPSLEWGWDTGREQLTVRQRQPDEYHKMINLQGLNPFDYEQMSQWNRLTLLAKQTRPVTLYIRTKTSDHTIAALKEQSRLHGILNGGGSFIIMMSLMALYRRNNQQKYRRDQELITLLDTAVDPILLLDDQQNIIYANTKAYGPLLPENPKNKTNIRDVMKGQPLPTEHQDVELSIDVAGDTRYYRVRIEHIQVNSQKRALIVFRDITEERHSLQQLETQNWRMDKILAGTNLGTWEWNVQTGETLFNERWAEIVGYQLEELQPVSIETWMKFAHPDDLQESERLLNAHFNGETDYYEFESRMIHRDGHEVWVLDRGRVFSWTPDGQPLQMYGTHQEITEQKELEQILKKNKEQAEHLNEAKDLFLANMSHEIRTPISGVIGTLNLLKDTPLDASQANLLGVSLRSAEAMLELINDILDLSKINAGKLEIEAHTFVLNELLDDLTSTLGSKANEKGVQLACPSHHLPIIHVTGDSLRIRQVLTNLVGNAIKFTQNGEVLVNVDVLSAPGMVTFSVIDTGIGLTEEQLGKLFQRFEQADTSTTRQYGGSGLGLYISQELVSKMGGTLEVSSEAGKGSCFYFTLPLETEIQAPITKVHPHFETSRLLAWSYNPAIRDMLQSLFSAWSLPHQVVSEPDEVYQVLQESLNTHSSIQLFIFEYDPVNDHASKLLEEIHLAAQFSDMKLLAISPALPAETYQRLANCVDGIIYKPLVHSDLYNHIQPLILGGDPQDSSQIGNVSQEEESPLAGKVLQGKILIAEDNITNQLITRSMVEKLGLSCDIASNGLIATEAMAEKRYDLILMDCQMPVMDGYKATEQLRASHDWATSNSVPVVALTANAMIGDDQHCYDAGMDAYLSKPLYQDQLLNTLIQFLGQPVPQPLTQADQQLSEPEADTPEDHQNTNRSSTEGLANDRAILDYQQLLERLNQDSAIAAEVLDAFLQDTPEIMGNLSQLTGQGAPTPDQISEAIRAVHTIKGAAANINGSSVNHIACELESDLLAHENDPVQFLNSLQQRIDSLNNAYAELANEIEQYLKH